MRARHDEDDEDDDATLGSTAQALPLDPDGPDDPSPTPPPPPSAESGTRYLEGTSAEPRFEDNSPLEGSSRVVKRLLESSAELSSRSHVS